jgi:hypothetical protein
VLESCELFFLLNGFKILTQGERLAIAEARLVIAKLLWKFDIELDGPQEDWVKGARFYVSAFFESPESPQRRTDGYTDPVGARASDGEVEGRTLSITCGSMGDGYLKQLTCKAAQMFLLTLLHRSCPSHLAGAHGVVLALGSRLRHARQPSTRD